MIRSFVGSVFFFQEKTAYGISACPGGSGMCIRDRVEANVAGLISGDDLDFSACKILLGVAPVPFKHLTRPRTDLF